MIAASHEFARADAISNYASGKKSFMERLFSCSCRKEKFLVLTESYSLSKSSTPIYVSLYIAFSCDIHLSILVYNSLLGKGSMFVNSPQ